MLPNKKIFMLKDRIKLIDKASEVSIGQSLTFFLDQCFAVLSYKQITIYKVDKLYPLYLLAITNV